MVSIIFYFIWDKLSNAHTAAEHHATIASTTSRTHSTTHTTTKPHNTTHPTTKHHNITHPTTKPHNTTHPTTKPHNTTHPTTTIANQPDCNVPKECETNIGWENLASVIKKNTAFGIKTIQDFNVACNGIIDIGTIILYFWKVCLLEDPAYFKIFSDSNTNLNVILSILRNHTNM